MNQGAGGSWSDEDRLKQIIAEYLQQLECGEAPSQRLLIQQHPDLTDELKAFFAQHDLARRGADSLHQKEPHAANHPELPTLPPHGPNSEGRPGAGNTPRASESPTVASDGPSAGGESIASPLGTKVRYFGNYELLEEIARGGMGVVYKARQLSLNRIVALKMILAGQLASQEDVQRFHTEAEAAAKLDHPGIVPIFEVGEHEGQHYFSMGFVEGQSLADRLADGPLPPHEAAELVKQLAEAMAYAHDHGVIHRDLKPANVLLAQSRESSVEIPEHGRTGDSSKSSSSRLSTLDSRPRITDFGLAKKLEADSNLTGTGQILGTPSYMPPEQASGKTHEIGPASDVYALGAVLYTMLTGRAPFQAANPMDTLLQVLDKEPIAPRQLDAGISRDLETICLRCLEKEPPRRYPSASELVAELGRFLNGEPINARPLGLVDRGWRWCKRRPAVASLAASVILLMLAGTVVSWYFAVLATESARVANQKTEEALTNKRLADDKAAEALREQERAQLALARNYWNMGVSHRDGFHDALKASHYFMLAAVEFENRPADSRNSQLASNALAGRVALQTVIKHDGIVRGAKFSGDESRILSWSTDGTARLWDAKTGEALAQFNHEAWVHGASFSGDENRILSWSVDRTARLWDAKTGEALAQFKHEPHSVRGAIIGGDESRILTWSTDRTPRLRDAKIGEALAQLRHEKRIYGVTFNSDESCMLSWSEDGTARLWDANTGEALAQFKHDGKVHGAIFSGDESGVLSWSMDGTARLWDAQTGKALAQFQHEKGKQVSGAKFNADESRVLSWCMDGTARLWDAKTGEALAPFKHDRQSSVFGATFSGDGRSVLSWSLKTVRLWDAKTGEALAQFQHEKSVRGAIFSGDESRVLSWSDDATARLWDANTGGALAQFQHDTEVRGAIFSYDESRVLSWSYDGTARLWDANTGEALAQLRHGRAEVYGAKFSRDDRCILSWSRDGTVRLWGMTTYDAAAQFKHEKGEQGGAKFNTDESRILSWGANTIVLWDAQNGETLAQFKHEQGKQVRGATINADESRILSWSDDGTARLWDVKTREALALFTHDAPVYGASLSGDERRILSWSIDGTLRLSDITTGEAVTEIKYHESPLPEGNSFFREDERRILSWSWYDSTVRLWDITTGEALAQFKHEKGRGVGGAMLNRDRSRVLSWSDDGTAWLWDVKTGEALARVKHETGQQVDGAKFSADESRILSWGGNTIVLWDAKTGETLAQFKHEKGKQLRGALLSGDESRILSWGHKDAARPLDDTAQLWDAKTGEALAQFKNDGGVRGATFSDDGSRILSWSYDGAARLWDAKTGEALAQFQHEKKVSGATFSGDESRILTWSADTVWLWDVKNGKALTQLNHGTDVSDAKFSGDESRILSRSAYTVWLWDVKSGEVLVKLNHDRPGGVSGAIFSGDESRILTWSQNGKARLWDTRTGEVLAQFNHEAWVYGASFSGDENRILSWSADRTARLWDAKTGEAIAQIKHEVTRYAWREGYSGAGASFIAGRSRVLGWRRGATELSWPTARLWDIDTGEALAQFKHDRDSAILASPRRVSGAIFSGDESRILTWSTDGTARLWDGQTGKALARFQHKAGVSGALFNADESRVLSWSQDGTARLWDAKTGEAIAQFNHEKGRFVYGALFSADESRVLSWSLETVKLWDIETGETLAQCKPEKGGNVVGAKLNADESRILGWGSNTIVLWDAKSGEALAQFKQKKGYVRGAFLSADESRVLSWSSDGTVRLWDVTSDYLWPRDFLVPRLEVRTGTRLTQFGELKALTHSEWLERKCRYHEISSRLCARRRQWANAALNLARAFAAARSADERRELADYSQEIQAHKLYEQLLTQQPENKILTAGFVNLLLASAGNWAVLRPIELKSAAGATLTVQTDGSVLASGVNPDNDVYTITTDAGPETIFALCLEALPEQNLPKSGPGRSTDGNFHLSELQLSIAPHGAPTKKTPVVFANVTTNYLKDGGSLTDAIDGDHETGWNNSPQLGMPHYLILEPDRPIVLSDNKRLTIQLHFQGPDRTRHTLGHFRLSGAHAPPHPQHWLVPALLNGSVGTTVSARARLGCAYFLTGKLDAAIKTLTSSVEQTGASSGYDLVVLSLAHQELGHTQEARQWYGRALDWLTRNKADSAMELLTRTAMLEVGKLSQSSVDERLEALRQKASVSLALNLSPDDPLASAVIPAGSAWKWLHPADGIDPATQDKEFHATFFKADYDDSHWQTGQDSVGPAGGFGYGNPVGVQFDLPAPNHRDTAYFRHGFRVDEAYDKLALTLQRDDGIIVYLDGVEVVRNNVVVGEEEAYDLFAAATISDAAETRVNVFRLPAALEPGDHVLAISLHNRSSDSSDLRIAEISLWGTRRQE